MQKNHKIFTPLFLFLVTFITYLPTFKYPFIYDDMPTIIDNIHVIKGNYLNFNIFFAYNRWISRFIHSFIYNIWGKNPTPFRIFNLIMHIIIGILIYFVLFKLLSNLKQNNFLKNNAYIISIFTSFLFLLHPAQTQTVTYITQMSLEGLVLFFTLLVLITFVYAALSKNKIKKYFLYSLSSIFTFFSAGTKEIIIILPSLILLTDLFFVSQWNWQLFKKTLPLHITLWVTLFFALSNLGFMPIKFAKSATIPISNNRGNVLTSTPEKKIEVGNYVISQFKVLLHYLRIYIFPFPLAFDYGHKLSLNFFDLDVIIPFLLILSILIFAFITFLKNKTNFFTFGITWFFIGILPRASFIPSTELVCDYKTYISSFGIMFLISASLIYLFQFLVKNFTNQMKFNFQKTQLSFIFIFLIFSALITKNQNIIWSNELKYWEHAITTSPKKACLYNNYGVALSETGRIDECIEVYKKACKLDPTYAEPVINLAFHYQARGQKELAMAEYKKAINMREVHPEMYVNLGTLHLSNKAYKEAEICFDIALKFRPYYSRAFFCKGLIYEEQNKLEEALDNYYKSTKGNHPNIHYYYKHGMLAYKLNKFHDAIESLEKVKNLNSNFYNTVFTLASIYYQKRDFKNAAINFEIEYKKNPENKVSVYNLAQSLLNLRQFQKALHLFEKCSDEENNYPYANLHIAKCLNELNQKEKAILTLKNLIQNSKHEEVKKDGISLLKELIT